MQKNHPPHTLRRTLSLSGAALILLFTTLASLAPHAAAAPRRQTAPVVYSVNPSVVYSDDETQIGISGDNFTYGLRVQLGGGTLLNAIYESNTFITAYIPAGMEPGSYRITVYNSDGTYGFLDNALSVLGARDATPVPSNRPLVVIDAYSLGADQLTANQEVFLVARLRNAGQEMALNIVVTFEGEDFVPLETGGVRTLTELDPGEVHKIAQPFRSTWEVLKKSNATLKMLVRYTDRQGFTYTETFNLNSQVSYGSGTYQTPTPTPTPTTPPKPRPQLVITSYSTDVSMLQPGQRFFLSLEFMNVGNADAHQASMIVGGGSGSNPNPPQPQTTPEASSAGSGSSGGISAGSGDFQAFAPLASSNVMYLGDLPMGQSYRTRAELIVNSTTNPGAYPFKISFTYNGGDITTYNDDQVVTLLVYQPPMVKVGFYRDPGVLFTGQSSPLPIQVVNLGRKSTILGEMTVSAPNAELSNNTTLVGTLDIGGYFTLDANVIPTEAGTLTLTVSIDYTDDFNKQQTLTQTLAVEVQEMTIETPEPGAGPGNGEYPPAGLDQETFWQKFLRFLRGLAGLDSAVPTQAPSEAQPVEGMPGVEMQPGP